MTACDPTNYNFEINETDVIERIELINYENTKQKHFISWVPNHYDKLVSLDLRNITVLEELDKDKNIEFINVFSSQNILYWYFAYDSPINKCIRIIYESGDFVIITANYENKSYAGYIGRYNSSGDVIDFYGSFESLSSFINLVDDYFETEID